MEPDKTNLMVDVMKSVAAQHFSYHEFNKLAAACIEYKRIHSSFLFGKLTLLHYMMFNGTSPEIYKAAAAVELMILSLDIFDDLQDQDQPQSIWSQCEPAVAMNVAIGFLMLSAKLIEQIDLPAGNRDRMIACFNTQVLKAVNGQFSDLNNAIYSEEEYKEMTRQKSGALVACACLVGTLAATDQHADLVLQYGQHIGIAAQIKNDHNDILRWDEKSDFLRRKRTLLMLYLIERKEEAYFPLRNYLLGHSSREEVLENKEEYEQLIRSSGVLDYAAIHMRIHQFDALDLLEQLPIREEWRHAAREYILFDV
ncbi:Polyprenyl synthetase [Paenibacillus curdlanolyticus YK9]|uniref:Polyprenyl synthetase n=1 Tax=Paenibacillus curdlanolyticus YK9 TaxID=717606 RepID=E0IG82_9BACL|nr:polyprenyl synthetase family protein [Paenibacillus curdlanolyticus]EFM08484.1 Polyprenyl synthetase [Paenibacillus curdlanolyticus YK9]